MCHLCQKVSLRGLPPTGVAYSKSHPLDSRHHRGGQGAEARSIMWLAGPLLQPNVHAFLQPGSHPTLSPL